MIHRTTGRAAAIAVALVLAGCADEGPGPAEGPSFACLRAAQEVGLDQATPAGEARRRIRALLDDRGAPPSEDERAFWDAHLDRLEGVPDDHAVVERLNGIPCGF